MSLLRTTVPANHCAVRFQRGVVRDVLPAGRHRRVRGEQLVRVDLRESLMTVAPQEVPTADAGVSVRISAVVRWRVVDAVAFLERSTDPTGTVYLAAQVALRRALAGLGVEDLTGWGEVVPVEEVLAAVGSVARGVGIAVEEVVVKDVLLPGELRHAALEVVAARQRGAAQLETARAETAALRSLANGAKLLDAHPALARLRLVQSVPFGSQLVLRFDGTDEVTVTDG